MGDHEDERNCRHRAERWQIVFDVLEDLYYYWLEDEIYTELNNDAHANNGLVEEIELGDRALYHATLQRLAQRLDRGQSQNLSTTINLLSLVRSFYDDHGASAGSILESNWAPERLDLF